MRPSESLCRTVFNSVEDAIFIHDMDGNILDANPAATERLGYPRDELLHMNVSDICSSEFAERVLKGIKDLGGDGISVVETCRLRRDGSTIPAEVKAKVIQYDGNQAILSVARDTTGRTQTEREVYESRERLLRIMGTIPDGVITVDANGRIRFANEMALKMLGISREEITGRCYNDPSWRFTTVGGEPFPEDEMPFARTMSTGKPVNNVEYALERTDGARLILSVNAAPMRTPDNKLIGVVMSLTDITERRMAEEELVQARNEAESLRMESEIRREEADSLREEAERAVEGETEVRAVLQYQLSQLQRALLPKEPSIGDGYQIAAIYLPGMAGTEIGGDFYDVFETEGGQTGILIGDVAGKGIPAASLAAAARSTIRAFVYDMASPSEALTHTNSVLCGREADIEAFVTASVTVLDRTTGRLCYANAAHPPAVIYRAQTGQVEFLGFGEPPIGVIAGYRFGDHVSNLEPGDKIVFYTDGISEARRGAELFDTEGIGRVLARLGESSPEDIVDELLDAARDWTQGCLTDDVAIIVIQRPA